MSLKHLAYDALWLFMVLVAFFLLAMLLIVAIPDAHGQTTFLYSPGKATATTPLGDISGDLALKELSVKSRGQPWSLEYRHLFNTKLLGSHELKEQTEHGGVKWEKGTLNQEVRFTGHTLALSYASPIQGISLGVGWQWLHGGQVLSGEDSEKKWREVDLSTKEASPYFDATLQSSFLPTAQYQLPYTTVEPSTLACVQLMIGQNICRVSGAIGISVNPLALRFGYLSQKIRLNTIDIRHDGPYLELGVVW